MGLVFFSSGTDFKQSTTGTENKEEWGKGKLAKMSFFMILLFCNISCIFKHTYEEHLRMILQIFNHNRLFLKVQFSF